MNSPKLSLEPIGKYPGIAYQCARSKIAFVLDSHNRGHILGHVGKQLLFNPAFS